MQPSPIQISIDSAIRKCLADGMTNLELQLGRLDYDDLLRAKAEHLGQSETIDTVSAITTYRGYPVSVDHKFASQVLHRGGDGSLCGYAVMRT